MDLRAWVKYRPMGRCGRNAVMWMAIVYGAAFVMSFVVFCRPRQPDLPRNWLIHGTCAECGHDDTAGIDAAIERIASQPDFGYPAAHSLAQEYIRTTHKDGESALAACQRCEDAIVEAGFDRIEATR